MGSWRKVLLKDMKRYVPGGRKWHSVCGGSALSVSHSCSCSHHRHDPRSSYSACFLREQGKGQIFRHVILQTGCVTHAVRGHTPEAARKRKQNLIKYSLIVQAQTGNIGFYWHPINISKEVSGFVGISVLHGIFMLRKMFKRSPFQSKQCCFSGKCWHCLTWASLILGEYFILLKLLKSYPTLPTTLKRTVEGTCS